MRTGVSAMVAAASAGVLLAPLPAAAAPDSTRGPHCVVKVDTGKSTCYDTFRESIAAATGGRITDAPLTPQKAAKDKKFLARLDASAKAAANTSTTRAAASARIGGWLFEHGWYGGRSLALSINADDCVHDGRWDGGIDWLGPYGFNDITSAVMSAGDCSVELYTDGYYQGSSTNYGYAEWVGSFMNDKASAVRLKANFEVVR
ncbi:hypothetical protein [Streptomyces sp. CAU 1734]|uniref:hypothetical protein n=1 Tax=Streptomyces sp. CAU 1734 TaxID=3140360 RepID=UPI0032605CFA